MELRDARRALRLELVGQTAKVGFATFAVVTLLIINSNLRQLVFCLGADEVPRRTTSSGSRHTTAAPHACHRHSFGQVTSLELVCCNGTVSLRGDGMLLVDYSDGTLFVDWIKTCWQRECSYKLNVSRRDCPKLSRFGSDFLCLNTTRHIVYGVFGGYRLSDGDSHLAVSLIANDCL